MNFDFESWMQRVTWWINIQFQDSTKHDEVDVVFENQRARLRADENEQPDPLISLMRGTSMIIHSSLRYHMTSNVIYLILCCLLLGFLHLNLFTLPPFHYR